MIKQHHFLLQANAEIHSLLKGFPENQLWVKPAGMASVAFHLQHIKGVLDRLLTCAASHALSPGQLDYLRKEGLEDLNTTLPDLLVSLDSQVNHAIRTLATVRSETVTEFRLVGRKQLPSTVLGLLFHGAEHTMRHTGQLIVTARFLVKEVEL